MPGMLSTYLLPLEGRKAAVGLLTYQYSNVAYRHYQFALSSFNQSDLVIFFCLKKYLGHHDFGLLPAAILWYLPVGGEQHHDGRGHVDDGGGRRPEGLELRQVGLVEGVEGGGAGGQRRLGLLQVLLTVFLLRGDLGVDLVYLEKKFCLIKWQTLSVPFSFISH